MTRNELEPLDRIFDGRKQFFSQPWLDDKAVNLALIDRLDHGVQLSTAVIRIRLRAVEPL